jgi:hypothetical protein
MSLRPGHTQSQDLYNPSPDQSFGNDVYIKDKNHVRIFFQDTKGLTSAPSCEDFKYYLDSLFSLETDIVGLSETNLPWLQIPHLLQAEFRQCMRRQFSTGKVAFGSPVREVDPVAPTENFQGGGNLTLAVGALVPMLSGLHTNTLQQDPTGLGRCWSG